MTNSHRTQIIKIGNSSGVRIPKEFLKSFISKKVIIKMKKNNLVISPATSSVIPRQQWSDILSKTDIIEDSDFIDFDATLNDGLDEY